mmetsp:Transcript_6101/g.10167  ORF Transcript_6101/g.10167 Transcript_6101/m.10167 type:complete len:339 (+) Transcript_6101:69-1085(+)
MSFKYLLIPSDGTENVVEIEASKSGGLEKDALRQNAETEFSGSGLDVKRQQEQVMADLVAKGMDKSQVQQLLNSKMGSKVAGAVEIITLSVPTAANNFSSVSLYCDGNSAFRTGGSQPNIRATTIARACGHKDLLVMGSCFVGRAKDDERCEWERLDFPVDDVREDAPWILETAAANAGKDMSRYSTSGSLSAMQNAQQSPSVAASQVPAAILPPTPPPPPSEFGVDQLYIWTQSEEEIEVRMKIPTGMKAKQLSVNISGSGLKVGKKEKTGAIIPLPEIDQVFFSTENGAILQGRVNVEDSTWSVADEKEGRLLTISLAKGDKKTWTALLLNTSRSK